jgi:serine/threonine protein kinase
MPQANQRVSEYILEEKLGAGSFGEVWRARHHVWSDRQVAIKIPIDPQYLKNLQREGSVVHGLMHPNIVRAMGFDPYADPPYLVMEYIPGTSLRPLIAQKRLSIDDTVLIMRSVLAGLEYAHQQGIVHRDIKPENVLIHERARSEGYGAEGVVKVTDFGLGRATTATAVGSILYSQSLQGDAAREISGTLDYMSPEQRSGADADGRADLWACGVMLYEMLVGERPAGTDLPSDINPKVPKYLDEVFRRAYARLDRRFTSAGEFLAALAPPKPSRPPLEPPPLPAGGMPVPPPLPVAQPAPQSAPPRVTCPECHGTCKKPGSDFTFCDQCRGRGKLTGRLMHGPGEVEVDCGKCRGRGYLDPEKCPTCRGRGTVPAPQSAATICPSCRHPVEKGDQFCMHCGVQLVQHVRRCPRCGAYPDPQDRYCMFCGETLKPATAVV